MAGGHYVIEFDDQDPLLVTDLNEPAVIVDPQGEPVHPVVVPSGSGRPGFSAYEIAVRNGFVGTEAQWLDSLQATATTPDAPLLAHIDSPTPHPVYDDLPSLELLFENGLI